MLAIARSLFAALPVAAVLALSACTTPLQAISDFDTGYNFSAVQSVTILPIDRTTAAEKLISDMQVSRINDALASELAARGYQVVEERNSADLYLAWHLVTRDKTDIRSYNSTSVYSCWRCGPPVSDVSVRQYIEGTFIVDLIDPVRNQSVWRSTIQSQLKAQPAAEEAAANRAMAARAIFEPFPPGAR